MTEPSMHSVAVAAVIPGRDNSVLLMRRRDSDTWEPPGGVLRPHEPVEAGVVREVREETRLEVEPRRLTGVYKNVATGVVSLVFWCEPTGFEAQTTDEARDVEWVALDRAGDRLPDDYAAWIEDAVNGGGAVPVRNQTGTIKGASASPGS